MIELLSAVSFWQDMTATERTVFCSYLIVIGLTIVCFIAFGIILYRLSGRRFIKSCKTIGNFCNESGDINDDNLEQFEATCLDDKTDRTFLEGWEQFKEARFGYPSEYVNSDKIKKKYSAKKFKIALFFTSLVLFLVAVFFSIYGIVVVGAKDGTEIAPMVIELVLPVVLLLSYIFVKPDKKVYQEYEQMLEDLDTAVKLQNFINRRIDNSRLYELEGRIRDIIVYEQNKSIPSRIEQLKRQKAEAEELALLEAEAKAREEEAKRKAEEAQNEAQAVDANEEEEVQDAPQEETAENNYSKEELDDIRGELFDDDNDEPLAEVVEEEPVEEAPKKKVIPFTPFVSVLNDALDKEYPVATMRKLANVLVLAFTKFEEPAQREELKNSIRKFIKAYKSAVERENAMATEDVATENEEVADVEESEAYESMDENNDEELVVAPAPMPYGDEDNLPPVDNE